MLEHGELVNEKAGAFVAQPPPSSLLERLPKILQFFHALLVSTVYVYPLLVTIVFWVILNTNGAAFADASRTYSNLSVHAFNTMFAYTDLLFLSRAPMRPWSHMGLDVVLIALYVGVAYITVASRGVYVYNFLDPKATGGQGAVAGYVVGIGAAVCIIFLIAQFLIWAREAVAAKLQGSGGWGSARPAGVPAAAISQEYRGPGPDGEGSSPRAAQ